MALVADGDFIEIDVPKRQIHLDVSDDVLERRRADWNSPSFAASGGYQQLYRETVLQADRGVDLDFLVGSRGHEIPRESH